MKFITIKSLLLLSVILTSSLVADYATEYRDLWYKWKAADDAFKEYTKGMKPGEPSAELKAKSDALGVEFFQAKRLHPALADQNAVIDGLQDELATAIRNKDDVQKDAIQKQINAAVHKLGELAKSVPELVDLENERIDAMRALNESTWAFDEKALKLFREVDKLQREIAELRAANGQ